MFINIHQCVYLFMEGEDGLSKVINACLCVIVGVALLACAVIPTCVKMIGTLTGDLAEWNTLLTVAVTMAVIVVIIGTLSYFTRSSKR